MHVEKLNCKCNSCTSTTTTTSSLVVHTSSTVKVSRHSVEKYLNPGHFLSNFEVLPGISHYYISKITKQAQRKFSIYFVIYNYQWEIYIYSRSYVQAKISQYLLRLSLEKNCILILETLWYFETHNP